MARLAPFKLLLSTRRLIMKNEHVVHAKLQTLTARSSSSGSILGSLRHANPNKSLQQRAFASQATPGKLDISDLDPFYLRDSCACPACVDVSTRQKLFETSDIPLNLKYKTQSWVSENEFHVSWENDIPGYSADHTSVFPYSFLRDSSTPESRRQASYNDWKYLAWERKDFDADLASLAFDYEDYIANNSTLLKAIEGIQSHGLVFIKNVPGTEKSTETMANRIGPLKNTFYGPQWDVRSVPSAKNVAYTSSNLDFHMDLLYMADPPGVQLLHVLKQSTSGGESRFSDAVRAFERLQRTDPDLVKPLIEFPVSFHYQNDGRWLQQTRYFIEGGSTARKSPDQKLWYRYPLDYDVINWAPPFQGPAQCADINISKQPFGSVSLKEHIRAAKKFKDLVSDDEAVFETKMEEGTCAIFNNRRVLHARKPFSNVGGERWLKGCYVDGDYLRDRYRYLTKQQQKEQE